MQLPTRVSAALLLCFLGLGTAATAQNQYVTLYPGANNSSTILQAYLPTAGGLLATASINTLPAGTFQILPTPDGTKYYIISNGGNPVSTMDANFQNIKQIGGSIALAPTGAALTPDGRKLVVMAGSSVYVVDVSSDLVIAPSGLAVPGKPTDVVTSIDSNRAYVLSQGAVGTSGTVVTAIDLTTTQPSVFGTPLTLNGDSTSPATGMTQAPSGYLYLSNNYRVFEINPALMKVTTNGEIQVQAYPGKPFITPDGKFLVCPNLRPVQGGTSLVQVDLNTRVPSAFTNFGDTLDRFYSQGTDSAGNNILYAVSTSGSLYDVKLGAAPSVTSSALNTLFSSGTSLPTFTGIQFSNETPPKLMWATNQSGGANFLYQLDIRNQGFTQLPIPATQLKLGTLSISPSSGGNLLRIFNNNQTVGGGQLSQLPIVAQLLDPSGRGIYRGQITFTSATPGVVIQTPNFITGSGGYAQTYITAPTAAGAFTVTANGGPGVNPVDFTFSVPGTSGGGGASLGGLYYISGNGQLVPAQIQSQPLVVQVLDGNANPVANAPVTYTLISGVGSLGGSTQITVNTDVKGLAAMIFISSGVNPGSSYQQAQIQVGGPQGNPVNFSITTFATQDISGRQLSPPIIEERNPNFNAGRVITATAGQLIKGAFQALIVVADGGQAGQTIPGVGVRVTNDCTMVANVFNNALGNACSDEVPIPHIELLPSASCAGGPLSDASGLLVCDLQIGPQVGTSTLYFVFGELNSRPPVTLKVTAGPPGKMTITSGNGQSGRPSDRLIIPYGVRVTDIAGNALGGVSVAWSVILGNATISTATSSTNSNGNTQVNVQLGTQPGPVKIRAQVNKDLFILFDANVNVVVSSVKVVSGDNQSAFTNAPFVSPLIVLVTDQQGIAVANTTVSFAATGGAKVSPDTGTTAADGTASTRVTAGSATGNLIVTATASGFQATFSNLTVKLPGPQITSASFLNAASQLQGLTPCGLSMIAGSGIAPGVAGTIAPTGFGPNPTSLGPVRSLTIGGFAAPLTSVSNINGVERVGFQTPCELPLGPATVQMDVQGGTTSVTGVPVVAFSPGMFESLASDGRSYAVALRPDGSFIGPANPAGRGETIRVFVTGLGQTTPAIGTNRAGTGGQTVNAQIIGGVNNTGVLVVKAEYVAGQIGTYFVDIAIPNDTTLGPYQPIAVAVQPPGGGELIFGNGVFIPIQ